MKEASRDNMVMRSTGELETGKRKGCSVPESSCIPSNGEGDASGEEVCSWKLSNLSGLLPVAGLVAVGRTVVVAMEDTALK